MSHLGEFDGKKLVSADRGDLELPELDKDDTEQQEDDKKEGLPAERLASLTKWMQDVLGSKIKEVHVSRRLEDSPAIIVNPGGFMTSSMERVMRATNQEGGPTTFSEKNLEINPNHKLIVSLDGLRDKDEGFARQVVEQIHDNAMIQAGLTIEPREMVARSYAILERVVKKSEKG